MPPRGIGDLSAATGLSLCFSITTIRDGILIAATARCVDSRQLCLSTSSTQLIAAIMLGKPIVVTDSNTA